jgi:hypothetical protein
MYISGVQLCASWGVCVCVHRRQDPGSEVAQNSCLPRKSTPLVDHDHDQAMNNGEDVRQQSTETVKLPFLDMECAHTVPLHVVPLLL